MRIEHINTFGQFGTFLEEVHEVNAIAYESLLDRFRDLNEIVGHSSQANEVWQKLKLLKPGDAFDKRIEDLASNILDFVLVGSNGVEVRANFTLLSKETGYFKGCQRLGGKEMRQMQSLSHFSGEALQLMIDFLTKGSFSLDSPKVLGELIGVAIFYGIPELKLKIESDVFFENHPQVIRPSMWAAWVRGLNIDIHTVTDEEAYTALSKGRNIDAILESPCRIYGKGKTLEEKRMYVYIPRGLTLTSLGTIFRWRSPLGSERFRSIWDSILEAMKDQATVGGWVEMTKDVIPESRSQTYAKQQEMIEALNSGGDCYQVPTTLEAVACCFAWYFEHQERLFSDCPWTHTRCQEQVRGFQVSVGGFMSEGLSVQCFGYDDNNFGVAAMRRLS